MNQYLAHSGPAGQPDDAPVPGGVHGGHGGRVFQTARALGLHPDELLDASNNANSLAADLTAQVLAGIRPEHRFYPDPLCTALRQAYAEAEGLPPDQILPVHGSAEGILLTLLALRPRSVCILGPIFSEYPRLCQVLGIPWTLHPLAQDADFALTPRDRAALLASPAEAVILCSPNNPTGQALENLPGLVAELGASRQVVVDLAYKDFLHGTPAQAGHAPAALLQAASRNASPVVLLTSLTKFYFCPGIRLGCVMAGPRTIARLAALQPPWSVTQLAQDAGMAFLHQRGAYQDRLPALRTLTAEYAARLREIPGVAHVPASTTNFVLVRLAPGIAAPSVAEAMLQRRMLVRDCDNIPGMPPGHLRLQVRTAEENARVAAALAAVMPRP